MKSTDGGQTWSWLSSTDGNPIYGLSCPSTTVCYATDIYAHVIKTTDGGATWTCAARRRSPRRACPSSPRPAGRTRAPGSSRSRAPTPARASRPGSTSPRPARRSRVRIRRSSRPPTAGTTWTRQTSGAGTGNYLHAVSCLPGTTTCTAVGRGGKIVTTTNLTTWTAATSGTTNMLNSVLLPRARRSASRSARTARSTSSTARRGRRPPATAARGCSPTSTARRQSRLLRDRQAGRHDPHDDRRHLLDAAGRRRHDAADERRLLPVARAPATRPATPARS